MHFTGDTAAAEALTLHGWGNRPRSAPAHPPITLPPTEDDDALPATLNWRARQALRQIARMATLAGDLDRDQAQTTPPATAFNLLDPRDPDPLEAAALLITDEPPIQPTGAPE
jgi:hypothetical protein